MPGSRGTEGTVAKAQLAEAQQWAASLANELRSLRTRHVEALEHARESEETLLAILARS